MTGGTCRTPHPPLVNTVGTHAIGADPVGAPAQGEGPVGPSRHPGDPAIGPPKHQLDPVCAPRPHPPPEHGLAAAEQAVAGDVQGNVGGNTGTSVLGSARRDGNRTNGEQGSDSRRGHEESHM